MSDQRIPGWIRWIVALVLAAQAGILALVLAGGLPGPTRNLLPQVLLGGAIVFTALVAWLLRFREDALPPVPARAGIVFLLCFSLLLVGVYFWNIRALLAMPYDLASWSEPMLVLDIIKLRVGAPLYMPAADSNSNTYTFLAPVVTSRLAALAGHPASIPVYRIILQLYLVCAALLAASATLGLLRLAGAAPALRQRRLWVPFFFLSAFLISTNNETCFFNVYLHNDPFALLVSTAAFWLLVKHATTRSNLWLWCMGAMPAFAFLTKQYLAIWAVAYVLYLWLDGGYRLRTVIQFAVASFGGLGIALLACLAVWGQPFRYAVLQTMSRRPISFESMFARFSEGGWYMVMGLAGGLVLLRGENSKRLLGIVAVWLALFFGGLYTSGITFHPSHLGPMSMVGGCLFLAALAKLWPASEAQGGDLRAQQWIQLVLGCAVVVGVFAALGFTVGRPHTVTPDLARYAHAIEHEFEGLPAERVLLDNGDWIYLRDSVVMKDRAPIFGTHHPPLHEFLIDRIQKQTYEKILLHIYPTGYSAYETGSHWGLLKELAGHYREVRRIPAVQGMENWRYSEEMMGEVAVYEPVKPDGSAQEIAPSSHE